MRHAAGLELSGTALSTRHRFDLAPQGFSSMSAANGVCAEELPT
jgi:hypothetical protein